MLYSELQRLEGMKDGISVDMVAVAEACFAQKLFGVFQMYASQTLSSTRWLMKPAGFVR